jgi:hypothetical protein
MQVQMTDICTRLGPPGLPKDPTQLDCFDKLCNFESAAVSKLDSVINLVSASTSKMKTLEERLDNLTALVFQIPELEGVDKCIRDIIEKHCKTNCIVRPQPKSSFNRIDEEPEMEATPEKSHRTHRFIGDDEDRVRDTCRTDVELETLFAFPLPQHSEGCSLAPVIIPGLCKEAATGVEMGVQACVYETFEDLTNYIMPAECVNSVTAEGDWKPVCLMPKLQVYDVVKIRSAIVSINTSSDTLNKGMQGQVEQVDIDGDVLVYFPDAGDHGKKRFQWIQRSDCRLLP